MTSSPATETCPNCGAEFRAGRLACPECGADANTAWKSQEELDYLSVELPESDDEVWQRLYGEEQPRRGSLVRKPWMWWAAIAALAGMLAMTLLR